MLILILSDGSLQTAATPVTIAAGDPPTVDIISHSNGTMFQSGDTLQIIGRGVGTTDGLLPANRLQWTVTLVHDDHVHPVYSQIRSLNLTMTIPFDGHLFTTGIYYVVSLTATDSRGLQNTTTINLFPKLVPITLASFPAGVAIFKDGIPVIAPSTAYSVIRYHHIVSVPPIVCINTTKYVFSHWSDSGLAAHIIEVIPQAMTYTVYFLASGACGDSTLFCYIRGCTYGEITTEENMFLCA